ncbi:MAG: PilN domain-containing protein [Sterolibacteriaceae bacterium MAG5]|nr:PilN domain-containing protein [Candidatus Nitricoxidireducens bremensis]
MIRVNLLPWREERRKARRQQFFALAGVMAVLAGVIWFMGYGVINGYIGTQDDKNNFLKREIAGLDKEIAEIKRLKEQTDSLLSRKRIIESLQANRTEPVHLFNELARQVPDGVYLKWIKQTGDKINLVGYAQSNARVSSLMRNLEDSPVMERPGLVEIKAAAVGSRQLFEFNLNVFVTRKTTEDDKKTGAKGKPAAKEGGA